MLDEFVVGDIEKNGGLEPAAVSPGHIVATETWITVVGNIYDEIVPPRVLFSGAITVGDEEIVLARADMEMDMVFIVGEVDLCAEASTGSLVDRPGDSVVSTSASGPC